MQFVYTCLYSYYPLVPPYRKEEGRTQVKTETTDSEGPTDVPHPPSEQCEVNLDYIQAFEEQYASLPERPDILLLPSDLKPFIKVLLYSRCAEARGCWEKCDSINI